MEVVVTGIGLVSALGGREETWNSLLAGRSGIRSQQPFLELPLRPLALIHTQPVEQEVLTRLVVAEALADAGLSPPLLECGVVIGSSRANQSKWERLALSASVPALSSWLDTLPHAAAIAAARLIGSTAPVLAPMAACATGLWSLAQGFELIQTGQCQRVIAGAVEAPITPLTLTGFARMGALAETGAYPFDLDREGLVLGEGGAVLVLETATLAAERNAKPYGRLLGVGLTADGYHISAPDPGGTAAIAAVQQCLDRSGLRPIDINYIHAHGTATRLNDRHEATLIQRIFPHGVGVSSTKGATGHTIGASGALGSAFCLLAMRDQVLPPCVGLRRSEFDLNLVTSVRSASVRHALCLSFGFGGQNAALALGSWE